jgi:SAM-dependent methyltransferase
MKNYFEYKFNAEVEDKLSTYYENTDLNQHNANHSLKSDLKLRRITKLTPFNNGDTVLDVGCSSGSLVNTLSPQIKKGTGVDISKNIIDSNVKNNTLKNISFETFDGNILNLKEKFNKVLLMDCLEHAFYPDRLIKTIKDNMAEDGILLVEVPFTGFLSELVFGEYHQGHLRYYDPDYLSDYLEKFGFRVVKASVYNSVPYASKFIKYPLLFKVLNLLVNLIPSKVYPYFGEILICAKNKNIYYS